MSRRSPSRRRGFTLMEILLVLAILVILGSLVGFYFAGTQEDAMKSATRSQMGLLKTPLDQYRLHMNRYPNSLEELLQPPADGNAGNWQGPYLEQDQLPTDAWGNPFNYQPVQRNNRSTFEIWSVGPDGVDNSGDEVR